ncbi:MAG: PKD domain-containing protein, partial [Anaerolineae bacterium]|nr:PKD domain-containing protein [Anaerolineae bacterium]
EAYYDGWLYPAYTSPVWIERPPIAEAGAEQVVATGSTVTLNGSQSSDPDGDALAFQWSLEGPAAIGLQQANQAQARFVAPNAPGTYTFRVLVTDPGGLSHADTTAVTVTNQPILSITKQGPPDAADDGRIEYTLTVVNTGVAPANNVRITDELPAGAGHVSGGTRFGNTISWIVPTIDPNGGVAQVTLVVQAKGAVINAAYQATCSGCVTGVGQAAVYTGWQSTYLPMIQK